MGSTVSILPQHAVMSCANDKDLPILLKVTCMFQRCMSQYVGTSVHSRFKAEDPPGQSVHWQV